MTLALCLSLSVPSHAFFGLAGGAVSGMAQVPYLIKILAENVKRYQQLRNMIEYAKDQRKLMKMIHSGLENSIGLLQSLPIEDEGILANLREFKQAYDTLQKLYGKIPKSEEAAMQALHDQTIAEALKMVTLLKKYAAREERNAIKVFNQVVNASPRGASRINAQTNAKILFTLNQLLKINGQMLKVQSEQLAIMNKGSKDDTAHYNSISVALSQGLNNFNPDYSLPKF